uniref:Proline rich 16 n=2 Tax=Latimeria chalumnae TaxID=7897 RepID=H3AEV6_LATCH
VVDQIDSLTCDLQLEEEMTDSSKTDTLNSSSSSTTASSLEKAKLHSDTLIIKPPINCPAVLTVLRKPNPPPPPPRLTPVRCEDPSKTVLPLNPVKASETLLRNGVLPGPPNKIPNGDACCVPTTYPEKVPTKPLIQRPDKERCFQTAPRERVRFSEKVQYHGYCPDCDVRYDMKNRDVHLHSESVCTKAKPVHCCPSPPPPPPLPPLENGGLGISTSNNFPPVRSATVPPQTAPKPQKTILRKSTTTTV